MGVRGLADSNLFDILILFLDLPVISASCTYYYTLTSSHHRPATSSGDDRPARTGAAINTRARKRRVTPLPTRGWGQGLAGSRAGYDKQEKSINAKENTNFLIIIELSQLYTQFCHCALCSDVTAYCSGTGWFLRTAASAAGAVTFWHFGECDRTPPNRHCWCKSCSLPWKGTDTR